LLEVIPYAQIAAAKGLCAIGAMAVDPLMGFVRNRGLDAEHPDARGYAVRALGCIFAKEPPLSELEQRVFALLVDMLRQQSNPSMVRWEAATALEKSRDPRAVEPLIGALADPDPWVRQIVTKALGALGDSSVIPALEEALRAARRESDELHNDSDDPEMREVRAAFEDLIWLLERAIAALRGDQSAEES
jgi:HEAT repeat protein